MYGLPQDFDTSVFVGKSLQLVSFTANTIHLAFDDEVSITVESSFAHDLGQTGPPTVETVPVRESRLMQLVERTVVRAEARDRGTLVLYFDNGQTFFCFDDLPQYESYSITLGDRQIIV